MLAFMSRVATLSSWTLESERDLEVILEDSITFHIYCRMYFYFKRDPS